MRMNVFSKLAYFSLAFALFMITPVYAAGNLTVTNGSLSSFSSSGDFWNTKMNVILNISLNTTNATAAEANITAILINITGTANVSNITGIFVYNDSNSNAIIDPSEVLLASNTSLNISTNYSFVNFTTHFNVPNNTKRNILVAYNISAGAFRFNTTGAQIDTSSSIRTSAADATDIVTISSGSINSTVKQVLDMHANATLTPRMVDTNVSQQMLVYTFTPSGMEKINRTKIIIPTGYSLVDVINVSIGGSDKNRSFDGNAGGGPSSDGVGISGGSAGSTEFNVTTIAGGTSSVIKINFTVDTNISAQNSAAFTSKIFSNISFIDPDVYNEETNVTTTQIIRIISVSGNKTAALTNGTDFWEFTFNLNFTANVSGLLQLKMGNWTSNQGTINLTNGTQFYASLRNDSTITNSTKMVNITNAYNTTQSISFNTTSDASGTFPDRLKHFVLRMTIPSSIPVSSNWWTVYSILFRSNPT